MIIHFCLKGGYQCKFCLLLQVIAARARFSCSWLWCARLKYALTQAENYSVGNFTIKIEQCPVSLACRNAQLRRYMHV